MAIGKSVIIPLICIFLTLLGSQVSIAWNTQLIVNQEIPTLNPEVAIPSQVYINDQITIVGRWLTEDSQPVVTGKIIISIWIDEPTPRILTDDEVYTNNSGYFTGEFKFRFITPGNYRWEVEFIKTGYQGWTLHESLEVLIPNLNINIDTPKKLHQGIDFYISATATYADNILDQEGQLASYVELIFLFGVNFLDKEGGRISRTAITDDFGIATVFLSGAITKHIRSVDYIHVTQYTDDPLPYTASADKLPQVLGPHEDPLIDRSMDWLSTSLEGNSVPYLVITTILLFTTVYLFIQRRLDQKRSRYSVTWPEAEIKE